MFGTVLPLDASAFTKIEDFIVFITVVSICAGVLYLVYRHITPDEPDELEFASTVFILTIAIGLLVSIIKHAPAISFGLFGAMSIVRFRSQIKRPQRMIFIFMAAAIGVCCGAGEYLTTVMGTIVLSLLTLASFSLSPVKSKSKTKPVAESSGAGLHSGDGRGLWGVDFLPASLADGRRYWVLLIVEEGSREALAVIPESSFSGARVVGELDRLIAERGKPDAIVSDAWPQFASRPVLDWQKTTSVGWHWLEQAAQPAPFVTNLAAIVGKQALAGGDQTNLLDARVALEAWRLSYNHALGDEAPPLTRSVPVAGNEIPKLANSDQREQVTAVPSTDAPAGIATTLSRPAQVNLDALSVRSK